MGGTAEILAIALVSAGHDSLRRHLSQEKQSQPLRARAAKLTGKCELPKESDYSTERDDPEVGVGKSLAGGEDRPAVA